MFCINLDILRLLQYCHETHIVPFAPMGGSRQRTVEVYPQETCAKLLTSHCWKKCICDGVLDGNLPGTFPTIAAAFPVNWSIDSCVTDGFSRNNTVLPNIHCQQGFES